MITDLKTSNNSRGYSCWLLHFQTSCFWPATFFACSSNESFFSSLCKLQNADSCQVCLTENAQVDHPDDSENFGGGQYCNIDGIGKDLDCQITSDVDYRCFDPDRDIDFVEYLDQDFTSYTSASPWHRRHKDDIDSAILYYCKRYTRWCAMVLILLLSIAYITVIIMYNCCQLKRICCIIRVEWKCMDLLLALLSLLKMWMVLLYVDKRWVCSI
jgi:hypothetical protein